MRSINLIVIHCSASPNGDSLFRGSPGTPGFQTPLTAINDWHKARGFKRDPAVTKRFNPTLDAIGYHFVIYRSGVVVTGRNEDEIGAHVTGFNQKSLGICLVGTDQFRPAQWDSLRDLVIRLKNRYPQARIVGHRDLSPDQNSNGVVEPCEWLKSCPGFDVAAWLVDEMTPMPDALGEM